MKKLILFAVIGTMMAVSAMAKQSVSKVSAKASQDYLTVSYTLAENWNRSYGDECSSCSAEGYVLLFADKNDAAMFSKSESEGLIVYVFDLEGEDLEKGRHSVSFDCVPREIWQQYPSAAVLVYLYDECSGWIVNGVSSIDFSAVSGATEEALRVYKKAQTVTGMVDSDGYVGTVTFKLGAIDKKKGTVKVTAAYTPFIGKKESVSQTVAADDYGNLWGFLTFKSFSGPVEFEIWPCDDGLGFEAVGDDCEMWTTPLGGALDVDRLEFLSELELDTPGDHYEWLDITPDDMEITVAKGTKWSLPKVPTIKYKKMKEYGYTWYELTGLDDEVKTNVSGLKLSYTAKTGVFKGSYTIYASNEYYVDNGKAPTLKKYKVTVSGVMVNGEGYSEGYGMTSVKIGKETYYGSVYIYY